MVSSFSSFIKESLDGSYYNEELNPKFWTKKGEGDDVEWDLDTIIRKKLLSIGNDFIEDNKDILKKKDVLDIQLVGSLAGYNWTQYSDLDLHIIVDFSDMGEDEKMIDYAMFGSKFYWNTRHDIVMRGHDVEIAVQDIHSESYISSVYSLSKKKWIKKPKYSPPQVDKFLVDSKFNSYAHDIDKLENKLVLGNVFPSNPKPLFNLASKLKTKIMKMRKESLAEGGEFSVGNLVFKKLRSEGYIEKLINVISKSYDKIYTI